MLGVDHREMCLFELKKGVALDRLQQDSWPSPPSQSFACLDLGPRAEDPTLTLILILTLTLTPTPTLTLHL